MKPIKKGTKFLWDGAKFTVANSVVGNTTPRTLTVTLERESSVDVPQPIGGSFSLVSGRKQSRLIKVKQETKKQRTKKLVIDGVCFLADLENSSILTLRLKSVKGPPPSLSHFILDGRTVVIKRRTKIWESKDKRLSDWDCLLQDVNP